MTENYNESIGFGQYKGLTIKEIYQGTLNIKKKLIKGFLTKILNERKEDLYTFPQNEFIEAFEVSKKRIKFFGEIHNPEKPVSEYNRVVFGDLQSKLSNYINIHFNENYLGIVEDIKQFNKNQETRVRLGGDPKYLEWCEREIKGFKLSNNCKRELEKLQVVQLTGFLILYIGNETYEYSTISSIDKYQFLK